jgi:hypothetical protein
MQHNKTSLAQDLLHDPDLTALGRATSSDLTALAAATFCGFTSLAEATSAIDLSPVSAMSESDFDDGTILLASSPAELNDSRSAEPRRMSHMP